MGPGRTGVKGVIRDQHEAQNTARDKRALEVAQLNKRMEKASLGGKTYLEEEREREIEKMMMEGPSDRSEKMDTLGRPKDGRFGHLREVGMHGFVDAVEREERNVWVVIHLYEPVRALSLIITISILISTSSQWIDAMSLMRPWRNSHEHIPMSNFFDREQQRWGLHPHPLHPPDPHLLVAV